MSTSGVAPVLVALHGHDDDAAAARRWATAVLPQGWSLIVPEAERDISGQRSWFDTGPRGVDPDSVARSRRLITEALDRDVGMDAPVVVAGFSQGAAMALALGAHPRVGAVVGFCGFLPEIEGLSLADGPPVLLLGAANDEVVPAFLGEDAVAALAAAGREATAEVLPGGHVVGEEAVARARTWLADRWPGRIRVSMGLPVERVGAGSEFVSGEAITALAAAYEVAGLDAAYVTDHPAPDDRWLAGGGHHSLEPVVALAVAATATTTLRLHTHVYVLAYRNPFLAAKALASLDVVSGGRLILGVAAGYLRPEFAALGVGFDDRGRRLDEALDLLPRIWADSGVAAEGSTFSARGVTALPRPAQRPHPPIWVGGNSDAALRRAVRRAEGWSPFPTPHGLETATRTTAIADLDDLAVRLARLDEVCAEEGRLRRPTVCFSPFALEGYLRDPDGGAAALVEEVAALAEMGIDWVALSVPGLGRSEVADRAAALAAALGL